MGSTHGYNNDFDIPFETFEDIGGGGKSSGSLPRRVSRTWLQTTLVLKCWSFAKQQMLLSSMGVLD